MKLFDGTPKPAKLRDWRTAHKVTQAEMANLMGLPLRTYEDIEAGKSTLRPIHVHAAAFAMIMHAAENGGIAELPEEVAMMVTRASETRTPTPD